MSRGTCLLQETGFVRLADELMIEAVFVGLSIGSG